MVAILALALGIGANTAMFSAMDAVLLRQLPYRDSDKLVMIWESNPKIGGPLTFSAVAALLVGIALMASYVPAPRAVRVDPMRSLRAE